MNLRSICLSISMLAAGFGSNSCKEDILAGTPSCIQDRVVQMQRAPVQNPPGSIYQYTYKGQVVFYTPPTCCDQFSQLVDATCHVICAPDGGLTGGGDGRCSDFYQVAKDRKLIWQDDRK